MTMDDPIHLVILTGSPRVDGVSERVAERMARVAAEQGAQVHVIKLSQTEVSPCTACGGCYDTGVCITPDAMHDLLDSFDAADAIAVVSPVYFAGVPAQLKAVIDRFESRWAARYLMGQEPGRLRPGLLALVGTGEDPYGYDPAVTVVRSAFSTIRVRFDAVLDLIGYLQLGDRLATADGDRMVDDAVTELLRSAAENR